MYAIKSPKEVSLELAQRLRDLRLQQTWSREELAKRAGVSVSCIKRFELTGEIALHKLLILSFTLGAINDFDKVLQVPQPLSISELKQRSKTRKRGRRS